VTLAERDALAVALVPRACEFACLVHDADQEGVASFLAAIAPHEVDALLVVLAALVDVEGTRPAELLAWTGSVPEAVKWRQDPIPPAREPEPCPSLPAYRRHQRRGEDGVGCGCLEAARAAWREKRARALARQKDAA
jgi:hypothetical protein